MSDALDIERTNAGVASSCAWPACPNGRQGWARVQRIGKGDEYLPACGRHQLAVANDPGLALRVWTERATRGPVQRPHVDNLLAESVAKEIRRVPGISRERLLAWSRMQAPQRGYGPVETRSGQPTLDDRDTDTLAALAVLVREERVRERKGSNGAAAYWSNEKDDDTSEETPCSTASVAAAPTTTAIATTTRAKSAKAGMTNPSTSTPSTTGTTSATTSANSAPPSPTTAAATPDDDCNEPATSRPPVDAIAASTPAAATSAAPVPTDPACPIALPSPSDETDTDTDEEPAMVSQAPTLPPTWAERLLPLLRQRPGITTAEAAAEFPSEKPVRIGARLQDARDRLGLVRHEMERRPGKPPIARWYAVDATPTPTETPLPKTGDGESFSIHKLRAEVADWKARAEKAEAEIKAAHAELAEWGEFARTGLDEKICDVRSRHVADARDLADIQRARTRWLDEEIELRGWRTAVEDALGFGSDDPEADVPHVSKERVVAKIEQLRVLLAGAREDAGCGHIAPLPGKRCALCGQADVSQPTIDGIPFDAALRLIAEVLDIDTSEPGPATIYDLSRVLQEIGNLRAAS